MRRYILYILFVLFLFCTAVAFAVDPYAHNVAFPDLKHKFFSNFANGKEATYAICIAPDVTDETVLTKAEDIVETAVENWLAQTTFFTRISLPSVERNEILTVLNNKKNIKEIPCTYFDKNKDSSIGPDLTIIFKKDVAEDCHTNTVACYNASLDTIFFSDKISTAWYYDLLLGRQNAYNKIMTHEMGHVFGLADQYEGTSYKGSYIYNSGIKRPSVMDYSSYVTCDDVDGFITTIDRIREKKRTFRSVCEDGIIIENGKAKTLTVGAERVFNEKLKYFDTEMIISYTDESLNDNTYLLDLTVYNFDKTDKDAGIYYLQQMGFYIDDADLVPNAKVKIHASFKERILPTTRTDIEELYVKINGLITSVLMIGDEEVQVLTWDSRLKEENYTRKIEGSDEIKKFDNVMLPLINYYPATTVIIDKFDEYLRHLRKKEKEEGKYSHIQDEINKNF